MRLGSVCSLFVSASFGLVLVGCDAFSSDPKPEPAPAPKPVHVHPDIPARPSIELLAQSEMAKVEQRRRDATRAAAEKAAGPPKNWPASCLVHRECAKKEQAVPPCEAGKTAPRWSEL